MASKPPSKAIVPFRMLSFSHRVPLAGADLELGVQIVARASRLLRRLKVFPRKGYILPDCGLRSPAPDFAGKETDGAEAGTPPRSTASNIYLKGSFPLKKKPECRGTY